MILEFKFIAFEIKSEHSEDQTAMEATVGAGYAQALFDFAVARDADAQRLAAASGFDPDAAQNPEARVLFSTFKQIMRSAKALCHEPALALHFGAESRFVDMSIVGLITHAAATMGEAFEQMNRFAKLAIEVDGHSEGARFAIVRREDEIWIEDQRRNPNDFPELTESTWARFVWNTRRHLPDALFAKRMTFTHPKPSYFGDYSKVLGVPVEFDCTFNGISFHESWLSIALPTPNRYVFGIYSDRAAALLADLEQQSSFKAKVESLLFKKLHTGQVEMASIARDLGLSRATLYRKLQREGVTFDKVVDALRHRLALDYLHARKVSVAECAYLVGFSDPASFSRAFKRWTGKNPSANKA
jgi:AraC-like DNA-binding protein